MEVVINGMVFAPTGKEAPPPMDYAGQVCSYCGTDRVGKHCGGCGQTSFIAKEPAPTSIEESILAPTFDVLGELRNRVAADFDVETATLEQVRARGEILGAFIREYADHIPTDMAAALDAELKELQTKLASAVPAGRFTESYRVATHQREKREMKIFGKLMISLAALMCVVYILGFSFEKVSKGTVAHVSTINGRSDNAHTAPAAKPSRDHLASAARTPQRPTTVRRSTSRGTSSYARTKRYSSRSSFRSSRPYRPRRSYRR